MNLAILLLAASSAFAQHEHHHHVDHSAAPGLLGPYAMTREASGTAWGPEAAAHEGVHLQHAGWSAMLHGYANGIYTNAGGPRGRSKAFSQSMLMGMASRPAGPGTFGLKAMVSLDPLMGKSGYPLLLQTGETADGRTLLVDRQHPHDLFMELAATYSLPVAEEGSVFLYGGYPGEPALGPAAFMHRYSGVENPDAPLSHHWMDSTHITFGVLTGGATWKDLKFELSGFRGREPDQHRWDMEGSSLDSWSTRLTYNPTKHWSMQASFGKLHSPEQLRPADDTDRLTVSAAYHVGRWQTTAAWGRNKEGHGHGENAYLLETAAELVDDHTVFGRWETVEKHDLLATGEQFTVHKLNAGYVYDFTKWKAATLGLGGAGAVHFLPSGLKAAYGSRAPLSGSVFLRAKLGASSEVLP